MRSAGSHILARLPHFWALISSFILLSSHSYYTPNVQGGSQGEQQTSKQNGRGGKFELTVFSIIKVACSDLDEKQYRQNHVQHREYHVVDHGLDLPLGAGPGLLHRSGHVPGSGEGGNGQQRHQQGGGKRSCQDFLLSVQNKASFTVSWKSRSLGFPLDTFPHSPEWC